MKFRTQYNYDWTKSERTNCSVPDLCVPDMSFTISDLLYKYTRLPNIVKEPLYDEAPDIDNPFPVDHDLTDLDEIKAKRREIEEEIKKGRKKEPKEEEKEGT